MFAHNILRKLANIFGVASGDEGTTIKIPLETLSKIVAHIPYDGIGLGRVKTAHQWLTLMETLIPLLPSQEGLNGHLILGLKGIVKAISDKRPHFSNDIRLAGLFFNAAARDGLIDVPAASLTLLGNTYHLALKAIRESERRGPRPPLEEKGTVIQFPRSPAAPAPGNKNADIIYPFLDKLLESGILDLGGSKPASAEIIQMPIVIPRGKGLRL